MTASALKSIEIALRANVSSFRSGIGLAAGDVKKFGQDLKQVGDASDKHLKRAGEGAMVMGGLMLAGFGLAAKSAMDFDKQISELGAVSGASAGQLGQLRQAALDAGQATVFSASQAAQAEVELAKAGVGTADILGGALAGALDLASAGSLDLGRAAEVAANAMSTFSLTGRDVPHVADVLAAAANKSAASVDEIAQGMSQTGLVASNLGLSLEDTAGSLAMFSNAGLKGSDAGTSMKTMLTALIPKSKEAEQKMEELGLKFFDASGNFVGLRDAAEQLQNRLGGLNQEQRASAMNTIFGSDAVRAASLLYRQGGEGVDKWTSSVNDSGYAAELARQKTNNLAGDVEALKGSIETGLIVSGTTAQGVLRSLVQTLDSTVNGFVSLPMPLQAAGMGMAGFGGAVALAAGTVATFKPKYDELIASLDGMGPAGAKAGQGISAISKGVAVAVPGLLLASSLWGDIQRRAKESAAALTIDLKSAKNLTDYGAAINKLIEAYDGLEKEADKGFFKELDQNLGSVFHVPNYDTSIADAKALRVELEKTLSTAIPGYERWTDATKRLQSQTGLSAAEIQKLANGAGVDLRGSLAAMKDELNLSDDAFKALEKAAGDQSGAIDEDVNAILAYRDGLRVTNPELSVTEGSFKTVASAASTAAEKLKAVKEAQDALIGVHISAFNAETQFAAGLNDLNTQLFWYRSAGIDPATEAGRKNRDMLAGAAEKALAHADAVRTETGDVAAGNFVLLAHINQLRGVMTSLGLTTAQQDEWLTKLGLTPKNVETMVALNGDAAAKAKLAEIDAAKARTGQGVTIPVSADTSQARAALYALWSSSAGPKIGEEFTGPDGTRYVMRGPGPQRIDGARASGGPVMAGGTYLVGEKGPELFTAGQSGNIVANGKWGAWGAGHTVYEDGSYAGMPMWAKKAHDLAESIQKQEAMRANPGLHGRPGWGALAANPFAGWAPGADFSQWGKPQSRQLGSTYPGSTWGASTGPGSTHVEVHVAVNAPGYLGDERQLGRAVEGALSDGGVVRKIASQMKTIQDGWSGN